MAAPRTATKRRPKAETGKPEFVDVELRHLDGCPEERDDGVDPVEQYPAIRPQRDNPPEDVIVTRCVECGAAVVTYPNGSSAAPGKSAPDKEG